MADHPGSHKKRPSPKANRTRIDSLLASPVDTLAVGVDPSMARLLAEEQGRRELFAAPERAARKLKREKNPNPFLAFLQSLFGG